MSDISQSDSWQALTRHRKDLQSFSLPQAFADDPQRSERFSLESCGIYFDYSKHLIDQTAIEQLLALAEYRQLSQAIKQLTDGEHVNPTEERPALHWLLRSQSGDTQNLDLQQYQLDIAAVKAEMKAVSEQVLDGQLHGYTGKPFTDIVNIGIGGSDLGPAMVYQALRNEQQGGIRCHFVANICAHDILQTLQDLDPHSTLFIIASKSFTTLETLTNAETAKRWLLDSLQDEKAVASHFFAVSSKPEKAREWGINPAYVFPFRDWVGGRYSVWSAIGLPLCLGLGFDIFERFLAGARQMDQHFFHQPPEKNMPVIMGMLGIWYNNFWHFTQQAIVPYDQRLKRFPAFLQQLEMESNGKCCTLSGHGVNHATGATLWGEPGSNSQHSFFQLLHQGTHVIPVDFIAVADGGHGLARHQQWLLANCLAQSRTLMLGQQLTDDALAAHKYMPGNRPSSTLLLQQLTPETLGALMALYEHKTYVQSVIWNINAFDQWGVELGKKISNQIKAIMDGKGDASTMDSSTRELLKKL